MNRTVYRLIGLAVLRGGKWYLRRRMPSARAFVLPAVGFAAAAATAVAIARRVTAEPH